MKEYLDRFIVLHYISMISSNLDKQISRLDENDEEGLNNLQVAKSVIQGVDEGIRSLEYYEVNIVDGRSNSNE